MKNIPIQFKIFGIAIIFLFISSFIANNSSKAINLYNLTKDYQLSYKEICQKQVTNYDGYYLAFTDKQQNANINKETFLVVTDIIMSNRKDGESLAWKWNTENQQIPYQEFTVFYKELSSFITERYKDNMTIEEQKQSIVKRHNLIISTFPNNLYNKLLNINELVYKQGYVSEYTKKRFN